MSFRTIKYKTYADFSLESIGRGILFPHLSVSAPSEKVFKMLQEALEQDYGRDVDLHILDATLVDDDLLNTVDGPGRLGVVYHGRGETFWIKNGSVWNYLLFRLDFVEEAIRLTNSLMAE